MPGASLALKWQLAQGGELWAVRELVGWLYTFATADSNPACDEVDRKSFRDRGWGQMKIFIKEAYEKKDGSAFRAMADAFEEDGPVDRIRSFCFLSLLLCNGRLPTQAELRRELISLGCENNESLRKAVSRACRDSERLITTSKPGRPRSSEIKGDNSSIGPS
jgi:hypothetical protein